MSILYFIIAIAVLVVVLKVLTFPIKLICKFIVNSILGGIVLYFLAKFGIIVAVTWWSILFTGFLGIPGAILSVVISLIIF